MTATTKPMTPYNAARKVRKLLIEKYGMPAEGLDSPVVWSKEESAKYGWGSPCVQVCAESGPYEWAVDFSLDPEVTDLLPGVFVEPYNSFILCFYKD